ncbi:MAG: hypothetical protein KC496_20155 [Anaerolineae bacterium]|nr:hypothetical protein [Anaerolineae bacterium]
MASQQDEWEQWDDFLYLADIQRVLYVEAVHYTAAFSEEIAQYIVDFLHEQNLVP